MHFYKDSRVLQRGNIVCAPCAGRVGLPLSPDEGEPGDLEYIGVTGVPEGVFRCSSCQERFIVYDGRVFREVT